MAIFCSFYKLVKLAVCYVTLSPVALATEGLRYLNKIYRNF